jgi:hypothetical protein
LVGLNFGDVLANSSGHPALRRKKRSKQKEEKYEKLAKVLGNTSVMAPVQKWQLNSKRKELETLYEFS